MTRAWRVVAALAACCVAGPALSQLDLGHGLSMTLRKSAAPEQFDKPARISYTKPTDGASSKAIDGALGLNFGRSWRDGQWVAALTAETHKNTALGKEQNKSLAGAASRLIIYLDDRRDWALLPDVVVVDEHDVAKHSRGLATLATLRVSSKPLRIGHVTGPDWLPLVYEPSIGYQRSDVRRSDVGRGRVNRLTAALSANAYPFGSNETKGWSLSYTAILWEDFEESPNLDDGRDRRYYRSFGVSYRFERRFSIGFSRISGENPVEGLALQKYSQLALEIRF